MRVNRKMIYGAFVILILLSVGYLLLFHNVVRSNFASEATLKFFTYSGAEFTQHEIILTEEEDIAKLRGILRGRAWRDSPSCGFVDSVSITLSNEDRSIMFSPALDGCPLIRVNGSDRYISISYEQRAVIDELFKRFDFTFPEV